MNIINTELINQAIVNTNLFGYSVTKGIAIVALTLLTLGFLSLNFYIIHNIGGKK